MFTSEIPITRSHNGGQDYIFITIPMCLPILSARAQGNNPILKDINVFACKRKP